MARPKTKRAKTEVVSTSEDVDPRFAPVIAAFARDKQVTTGKMMASVGLKVGGKIFAMMSRGKFVAKLPKNRVDELVQSGAGAYFDPRRDGRLMKEWIELAGPKPPWVELATEAYRFVKSKTK
jgi:TfoX/Sxy family transcriptional regulator of competence genes